MLKVYLTVLFLFACNALAVTTDVSEIVVTESSLVTSNIVTESINQEQMPLEEEIYGEPLSVPAAPPLSIKGFIQPINKMPLQNVAQPGVNYDLLRLELSSALGEEMQWYWRNDLYLGNSLKDLYFAQYEIREVYLDWYSAFGDFRLGKQIITWGMADENNPMDNINPVDLYDPFQEKNERKYGVFGIKTDQYFSDYTLTLVWLPGFKESRLPSSEYIDMPSTKTLGDPRVPEDRYINTQYAARLLKRGQGLDWSISYYDGYEKIYSPIEYILTLAGPVPAKLGYRRTKVTGVDFAADVFDFDVRGEAAYFNTEDIGGENDLVRNPYYQYIIGASYKFENDLKLGMNYAEEVLTRIDNTEERELEENNFSRMGMQLCMFTPKAIVYTLEKEFVDQHIKIKGSIINDLKYYGAAAMTEFSWEALDNLTYSLGFSFFGGSSDSILGKIDQYDAGYLKIKYSF
ncbi:MAG: hypothetical protein KKA19_08315 [Candidatus Margulisbacteria bacterium]|nr:hypothetical protein [Candidatus Margulisiibacteriota bacterium]